ncbi:hypothetical protein RJ640_007369 [Escallonia rubra]|uniref:acetylglutamate kinase n=1 Tax=Escallonia rubra TaxID=112253 RepID=A0AA88RYU7_9ASTE|nr:hypothetical protein RJ640_007369 [Escallonia rubra]
MTIYPKPSRTFPYTLFPTTRTQKSRVKATSCLKLSAPEFAAKTRVQILSEALPFIQKFRAKTTVVKYGGAAMKSEALQASVIADLVLLSCVGPRIVFVHGDGPEINHWLNRLGIEPNFHNGLRVTNASTMEVVAMVLVGNVNKKLVALINKAGATAIGLPRIDGRLLISEKLGLVGDIASAEPSALRPLIDNYYIPVITSVAADGAGQMYNVNADTAAGELAAALGAEKLILLTDVAGILEDRDDPESLVKEIDIKCVKKMIEEGKIVGGMIPKVNCCVRSLAQGVGTMSIIDGRLEHSLLLEILTDEGAGTMITGNGKRPMDVVQEFILGEYDVEATADFNQNLSDISTLKDPRSKDASQRYHAHLYTNGTTCDLTNQPRETEVRFVCSEPRVMISSITELSTCKYALTVQGPMLCKHPLFQEERPQWQSINCNVLPKDYKEPKMEDNSFQDKKIAMVTEIDHPSKMDSEEYGT